VALGIHKASARNERRFVLANCGAIPVELMESEFLGHGKGVFIVVIVSKIGFIQEVPRTSYKKLRNFKLHVINFISMSYKLHYLFSIKEICM
jgi:hypothetical protein